ncbi:MAG: hypothetical protein DRP78_05635, partial [Candidatus Omnitrophota bacterium]
IYAHNFSDIWNSKKQKEFRHRALCSSKEDVFFSFMGNDQDAKVGCYKSCDDLARNINMHKKIQSLTFIELKLLKLILFWKKFQRYSKQKKISTMIKKYVLPSSKHFHNILQSGRLQVTAHNQGVKLYYAQKELTQNVGLNTSVCIFGLWYDSSKADWKITFSNHKKSVLENIWRKIPISQQWYLKFINEYTLEWNVKMTVDAKIEAQELKFSLTLDPVYKKWAIDLLKGSFPTSFNWQEIKLKQTKSKIINISAISKKHFFPRISFDFSSQQGNTQPQLQNLDKAINARIISARCIADNQKKIFLPGEEYDLFSGKFLIQ